MNFTNSSASNQSEKFFGTHEQILFSGISTSILAFFGLPADILIFYLVFRRPELRRGNNSFIIINLLIADLACLVSMSVFNTAAQWYKLELMCTFSAVVTYTTAFCSWFNYLLLSADRYSILRYAEFTEKHMNRNRLYFLLLYAWAGPLLMFMPYFVAGGFGYEEMHFCGCDYDVDWKYYYDIIVCDVIWIGGCYHGAAFCVFQIVREVRSSKAPFGLTRKIVKKLKSELLLLILYGTLPVFLQVPLVAAKATRLFRQFEWIDRVLVTMYLADFAITPFLVLVSHKAYLNALKEILFTRKRTELGTGIKSSTSKHVLLEYFLNPEEIVR